MFENGQISSTTSTMGLYTTYVSPYMVVDADQKYTKHYFNGTARIVSRYGDEDISVFEESQLRTSMNKNATTQKENEITTDFETLKNRQISDLNYYLSKNATTSKKVNVKYAEYKKESKPVESSTSKVGDDNETNSFSGEEEGPILPEMFYYHSDHLGTGTFLSDIFGNPYQFFLNLPFGETMMEQHSYSSGYVNKYKFNGKELDEETGFYYYGARYYNPRFSIWLSTDPLAEMFPSHNPYNYCMQNPINLIDPTGMAPEDGDGDPPKTKTKPNTRMLDMFFGVYNNFTPKGEGWFSNDPINIEQVDIASYYNPKGNGTVSQRVPNSWEMLRDDSIIGSAVYETFNALTVIPQMCMFRSVSGGTMKALDGKAMSSDAALMGFVSTGITFFGGEVAAMKAAAPAVQATEYTFTNTAGKHLTEVVKRGPNKGQLARPYMNSTLTIEEIMSTGKGTIDATFKGGMNWKVPGSFRGSNGIWELGVNPKTKVIYHFNFVN